MFFSESLFVSLNKETTFSRSISPLSLIHCTNNIDNIYINMLKLLSDLLEIRDTDYRNKWINIIINCTINILPHLYNIDHDDFITHNYTCIKNYFYNLNHFSSSDKNKIMDFISISTHFISHHIPTTIIIRTCSPILQKIDTIDQIYNPSNRIKKSFADCIENLINQTIIHNSKRLEYLNIYMINDLANIVSEYVASDDMPELEEHNGNNIIICIHIYVEIQASFIDIFFFFLSLILSFRE